MKLSELPKGIIFKFENKGWEALQRVHSIEQIDGRFLIRMMGLQYAGNVEAALPYCFTWRDEDLDVFIPKFYLSEQKRTKNMPCIPVNNQRHILPNNLHELNMSGVYCSHDKYWYNLVNE